jgi:hypothetical protein
MNEFKNGTRVEYKDGDFDNNPDRRRGRRDDDGDYGDGRDAYVADGRGKDKRSKRQKKREQEEFNGGKKRKNSRRSSSISSLDDSESNSNSDSDLNSNSDEGYLSTSSLNTSDINIKHYR